MRVAIADDHGIVRDALARCLDDLGWRVVISVGTGPDLVRALETKDADVAVIDVWMPPSGPNEGVVTARQIRAVHGGLPILLMSAHIGTSQAVDLLRDFDRGMGYLLKEEIADVPALREAIERVVRGELVVGESIWASCSVPPRVSRSCRD